MRRKIEYKVTVYVPERIELPSDEIADDITTAMLQWDESLYSSVYIEELEEEIVP
jgi:hypothetical protein